MEKPQTRFPETPGVYTFWQGRTPIYVGKAVNLKARITSYFNLTLLPKTKKMVKQATRIGLTKVNSELEALLLEAKLIREFQPKFNAIAKDDKRPLYITITKEKFPRVVTTRRFGDFGPFPSSSTVYSVLKMIRQIFPYSEHKIGKRKCLYAHIGLCNPCPNEILKIKNLKLKIQAEQKYNKNVKAIRSLLGGRLKSVDKQLNKEMQDLSSHNKFEEAVTVRDQIFRLAYITQPIIPIKNYLENPNLVEDTRALEIKDLGRLVGISNLKRIECYDISHLSGSYPTASMVVFIDGEAEKRMYRHFRIRQSKPNSDFDSIKEIAARRSRNNWDNPDLIIVDGGALQVKAFKSNVPVAGIAKNPDRLIVGNKKIKLSPPALYLVQRMRDEAHRFARRYHHTLISKSIS